MIVPVVNCTMPGKNKDKTLIKTTTTTAISHAIHMHLNIVYQSQYNFNLSMQGLCQIFTMKAINW